MGEFYWGEDSHCPVVPFKKKKKETLNTTSLHVTTSTEMI